MTFPDLIEDVLDQLMPQPQTFLPLKYVEERHIIRAFLITGSITQAAPLLGISLRTVRNRVHDIFPPDKILALPDNRGRTDVGFLIEYAVRRMPPGMKLPQIAKASPVWRNNRIRGLALHTPEAELHPIDTAPEVEIEEEDVEYFYPCHRDFKFWDWYMNRDSIKSPKPQGSRTNYGGALYAEEE